jgi:hypothetical protein
MELIRLYKPEDYEQVKVYCSKHNIALPVNSAILLVSFDKSGTINGICGLRTEYFIEPLIAENPQAAYQLGIMVEGYAVGSGIKTIRAEVPGDNVKHCDQLEKAGFVIVDKNRTIMEKNYHG